MAIKAIKIKVTTLLKYIIAGKKKENLLPSVAQRRVAQFRPERKIPE